MAGSRWGKESGRVGAMRHRRVWREPHLGVFGDEEGAVRYAPRALEWRSHSLPCLPWLPSPLPEEQGPAQAMPYYAADLIHRFLSIPAQRS